jgi:hypothetical protein
MFFHNGATETTEFAWPLSAGVEVNAERVVPSEQRDELRRFRFKNA